MTIESFGDGGLSITGKRDIHLFALLQLKHALKFELKTGMKMSRVSALSTAKARFGLKGNKQKVYDQLCKIVDEYGQKRDLEVMAETGENN